MTNNESPTETGVEPATITDALQETTVQFMGNDKSLEELTDKIAHAHDDLDEHRAGAAAVQRHIEEAMDVASERGNTKKLHALRTVHAAAEKLEDRID